MSRTITLRYLSQEDVTACGGLDMPATIAAVEEALRLRHAGESIEPRAPMIHWDGPHLRRITMHAAFLGGPLQVAGLKWVPSNPDNPARRNLPRATGIILLTDPETGHPLAVMDGNVISAMRTGAVVGLAARVLGAPGARTAALIGAGVIGRTQLLALHEVLADLRQVRLFDLDGEKARAFAAELSARLGVEIEVAASARDAVRDADVVAPATNVGSHERYLPAEWLKPGALLVDVSLNDYTPAAVLACGRVVVDDRAQLEVPGLLLGDMAAAGTLDPRAVAELGEVLAGEREGRASPGERVFFSPMGMGIEDVINAHRVYRQAEARGAGTVLELWKDPIWT